MKNSLTILTVLLLSAVAALAQGVVNFSTRVTGTVVGHVYRWEEPDDFVRKLGNTASETPAGIQVYTGAFLTGSDYSAQLWAANGANQPESALIAIPGSIVSFRTGATLGGTPAPVVLSVPWIPPGGTGTFQVRAWYNAGGFSTSWDVASFHGRSALFNVSNLGDGILTLPANLDNFRSFNLYYIPEPSSYLLLALGGLGLALRRRHAR